MSDAPLDVPPRDALPLDAPPRDALPRDELPHDESPRDALPRDALPRDAAARRRYCRFDGNEHVWKIYGDGVGCARCMVPLSARELLDAYVSQHGGKVHPW